MRTGSPCPSGSLVPWFHSRSSSAGRFRHSEPTRPLSRLVTAELCLRRRLAAGKMHTAFQPEHSIYWELSSRPNTQSRKGFPVQRVSRPCQATQYPSHHTSLSLSPSLSPSSPPSPSRLSHETRANVTRGNTCQAALALRRIPSIPCHRTRPRHQNKNAARPCASGVRSLEP